MRRIKIGDVFYIKLTNGYKLFQWSYDIPRKGQFLRIFHGLFDSIPENIEDLVNGEHSYIIAARIRRLYRIGIAEFLVNLPVPEKYPFPEYNLEPCVDQKGKIYQILFLKTDSTKPAAQFGFDATCMAELPKEYQGIKLLNGYLSPALLLYLFDYDFNLDHLERFWPQNILGDKCAEILDQYIQLINTAEARTNETRK